MLWRLTELLDRFTDRKFSKHDRVIGSARSKLAASLKRKYKNGASIRSLAEETGRSYGFIHRILVEAGVELRAQGGSQSGATTRRQRQVSGTVYYMRIGNRVKIGWTSNLKTRMASINPEELLASEPGTRDTERERHQQFDNLRIHGEWFAMEEPLLSHIESLRPEQEETA
jgi:hypothetical protein